MPPSQFSIKDPKAVARGKQSGIARRIKAQQNDKTPMKREGSLARSAPATPMKVDSLPAVANGTFAVVNSATGKKICYETAHIPAGELQGHKRKMIKADEFLMEATRARKRLKEDVFNSALSQAELSVLDLSANSTLFPEIVNRDTDLRKRPLREHERRTNDGRFTKGDKLTSGETGENTTLQAVTAIPTSIEISEQLREKSKWFKDIEKAATKQADAYESAAKEVTNSMTNDDKNRDESRAVIPTSGLETALNEDIPRLRNFSRDEWRSRQNALLSHVHALAENYRQELSGLATYANKAIKTLDKTSTSAATLLWHLSQHEVPDLDLDAWAITEASEDSHRCECAVCQGREAAEDSSPIGLLRKESEKSRQEAIEAREALLKEPQWETATAPVPTEEESTSTKVKLLQEKWDRWFLEREQAIERDHGAFLRSMGEKKAHIEWEMDARRDELELYEDEIEGIEDGTLQSVHPHHFTQLYEAMEECGKKVLEDQKICDANLDVEEFVELYSIPVEEREGWLVERWERDKNSPPEKTILREARKALQPPCRSVSLEWKTPQAIQMFYEELPAGNIKAMDHCLPLLGNEGLSAPFDFRTNEVWSRGSRGRDGEMVLDRC